MNRYDILCSKSNIKKGIFVPFVILGDPNINVSIKIITTLIISGADALEFGIPFSDPISDGITIQKSIQRAFKSGINFLLCLKIIKTIRKIYPKIPIGLLVYANLVFNYGIKNFYLLCSDLQIDSILIPDVPIEEISPFYEASIKYGVAQIFICPPNADIKLIQTLSSKGKGYIYLTSRSGVTGINQKSIKQSSLIHLIKLIHQYNNNLPILQGFGIYKPKQAKQALISGVSGIISGSFIATIIEKNIHDQQSLLKKLKIFVHSIKSAIN